MRPLGIPTGDDKLVQEVARIIVERIYEPIFSGKSHGFRPRRSCHTALEQIQKQWTGMKWFIEFDIKGFFDNMDHEIILSLLSKRIDDKRFIKLIKSMLKAGYLEDWKYHPTYSGTPQGGVISPILSNIYLHELDSYMQEQEKEFNKGKKRKRNPEYQRLAHQIKLIRRKIDQVGRKPDLIEKLRKLDRLLKAVPSGDLYDEGYRRLRYCRYADDFIVGIIGPLEKAKEIMDKKPKDWNIDEIPNTLYLASPSSELVKRLNYKECEYCRRDDLPLESHHVRKLKDLRKKPNKKKWEQVMIARNRKTLVICIECHDLLHAGKLSDKRYKR